MSSRKPKAPPPAPRRQTLRSMAELAQHLGVSVSTVAKALAGDAKVAAATRERVVAAAHDLGYRPNPAASLMAHLRHRSSRDQTRQLRVALLSASRHLADELLWQKVCEAKGVEGMFEVWPAQIPTEKFLERLWHRGVSGLVLWMEGFPAWPDAARAPIWSRFSAVKLQRVRADLPLCIVRHDAFDYTRLALQKSMEAARRKICVVLWQSESQEDNLARLGAVLAFSETVLPKRIRLVWRNWNGPLNRPNPEVMNWLVAENPDVILFYHFIMLQTLENSGWPTDFSPRCHAILSAANYPYLRHPLAGCDTSEDSHLERALSLLLEMIGHGNRGFPAHIVEHIIEPSWLDEVSHPR